VCWRWWLHWSRMTPVVSTWPASESPWAIPEVKTHYIFKNTNYSEAWLLV
jgi:hypothetical protein